MNVRRLGRERAEAEAIRIASELVADQNLPLIGATPATRSAADLAGKTPIRWRVLFENRATDGTVFEGAVFVYVDLGLESAEFERA